MLPQNTIDLLPQKFPFVMVDTLIEASDVSITTSFVIESNNVLVSNDRLCEGGLIENIAQSAAAGTGYYFNALGKNVPVGYIGAVKNLSIIKLPKVGDQINTELHTMNQIGNASIVAGKIFLNKELIASCELTIFVDQ